MTEATATPAAPAAPAAPAVPKIEKNGVTRPKSDTKTGAVWDISDRLSAALGRPASRKEVMDEAKKAEINEATVATQYGRWRKFNGITGTVSAPKPAAEPKAEKPKRQTKKEKEAAAAAAGAAPAAPVPAAPAAPEAEAPAVPAAPVAEDEQYSE
jgi:hypothetical protein